MGLLCEPKFNQHKRGEIMTGFMLFLIFATSFTVFYNLAMMIGYRMIDNIIDECTER